MAFDINIFDRVMTKLMTTASRDPDYLNIGEDISAIAAVKIIFDGYGYNEETDEEDDVNFESYAIFIHKDADKESFVFPEHEQTPWAVIHRPKEEVCFSVWHNVENDTWEVNPDVEMEAYDDNRLMEILLGIEKRHFN